MVKKVYSVQRSGRLTALPLNLSENSLDGQVIHSCICKN